MRQARTKKFTATRETSKNILKILTSMFPFSISMGKERKKKYERKKTDSAFLLHWIVLYSSCHFSPPLLQMSSIPHTGYNHFIRKQSTVSKGKNHPKLPYILLSFSRTIHQLYSIMSCRFISALRQQGKLWSCEGYIASLCPIHLKCHLDRIDKLHADRHA